MRTRIQAEQGLRAYTRRHKEITVTATLGTNSGVVDHPTRGDNWIYARLHGDANQIVVIREDGVVPHVANLVVELEEVRKTASSYYRVKGLSSRVVYGTNPWSGTVGLHGWTHERQNGSTGGTDPINVYARMVAPLRARAQTTPDMTLYVESGFNPLTGNLFAGGNTTALTAPATQSRIDLLYLGDDDALHWVTGSPGVSPAYPAMVLPSVPIAFVWLNAATTTLQEMNITDDPGILRSAVGYVETGVETIAKSGSTGLTGAVTLSQGAGITLTQAAQNIEIASTGIANPMDSEGDMIYGGAAGVATKLDAGTSGYHLVAKGAAAPVWEAQYATINFIIDGGGTEIADGDAGDLVIDFACAIISWTLLAKESGAIKIDIWKDTYANYPPTDGDTICNGHEPEIAASGVKAQDTDLSDWIANPPTIAAGETLHFNVDSCTTIQRVTLALKVRRT